MGMKKIWIVFMLVLAAMATAGICRADWLQDGTVLNINKNGSYVYSLAFFNDMPYVGYKDEMGGMTPKIYVMHQQDGAWVQDGNSLNASSVGSIIRLAVNDFQLYAALNDGNVKHLNGTSWEQDGGTETISAPALAVSNSVLYAARMYVFGGFKIFVKHLDGSNWVQDGGNLAVDTLTNGYSAEAIGMINFKNTVYSVWSESGDGTSKIYVKHLSGNTWVQDGDLNSTEHGSVIPKLTVVNDALYIAWADGGCVYVYHLSGSTWVPDQVLGSVPIAQLGMYVVGLINVNNMLYVALRNGSHDITPVYHLSNNTWIYDGTPGSGYTAFTAYAGKIYTAGFEGTTGNSQLYIKHWAPAPTPTSTPTSIPTPAPTPVPTSTPVSNSAFLSNAPASGEFKGEIISPNYIYAAPNPVRGNYANIHVFCKQPSEVTIKIFTLLNRELKSVKRSFQIGDNLEKINIGDLADGGYFLLVKARTDQGVEEKITAKIAITK